MLCIDLGSTHTDTAMLYGEQETDTPHAVYSARIGHAAMLCGEPKAGTPKCNVLPQGHTHTAMLCGEPWGGAHPKAV